VFSAYLKLKVTLKNHLKERRERKTKIQEELKNSKNLKLDTKFYILNQKNSHQNQNKDYKNRNINC